MRTTSLRGGLWVGSRCWRSAFGLLGPGALALSLRAVEVPDPSPMLPLVPRAVELGAPPSIRAGTRLTFFGMTASIPGEYGKLVEDEHGGWVDRQTGKRYREEEIYGAAAAAFSVVQVGQVGDGLAQLNTKLYLYDPVARTSRFTGGSGMVGHAGCAADYWIHPSALNAVAEVNTPGLRILRMPCVVDGKTYRAIRFQRDDTAGYHARMYDLDSGLLIRHVSRVQGPSVATPPVGGSNHPGLGDGSTQLVVGWLKDVTQVDVPWGDEATPSWVSSFRNLSYQGSQTSEVPAADASYSRRVTATVTPRARGRGWVRFAQKLVLESLPGMPPGQEVTDGACGCASLGGLWIAPSALGRLAPGQVIDRNPLVGLTVVVSTATPGAVTLSETGPHHRIDCTYDRRTGVLSELVSVQQIDLARITVRLRLDALPE